MQNELWCVEDVVLCCVVSRVLPVLLHGLSAVQLKTTLATTLLALGLATVPHPSCKLAQPAEELSVQQALVQQAAVGPGIQRHAQGRGHWHGHHPLPGVVGGHRVYGGQMFLRDPGETVKRVPHHLSSVFGARVQLPGAGDHAASQWRPWALVFGLVRQAAPLPGAGGPALAAVGFVHLHVLWFYISSRIQGRGLGRVVLLRLLGTLHVHIRLEAGLRSSLRVRTRRGPVRHVVQGQVVQSSGAGACGSVLYGMLLGHQHVPPVPGPAVVTVVSGAVVPRRRLLALLRLDGLQHLQTLLLQVLDLQDLGRVEQVVQVLGRGLEGRGVGVLQDLLEGLGGQEVQGVPQAAAVEEDLEHFAGAGQNGAVRRELLAVHRDDDITQGAGQTHLIGPLQERAGVSGVVELEHTHDFLTRFHSDLGRAHAWGVAVPPGSLVFSWL